MALRWIKLSLGLRSNVDWLGLSPEARLSFLCCLMLAGELDQNGRLASKAGALPIRAIARETGLPVKQQEKALEELLEISFLSLDADGAYFVEKFNEKAGDDSRKEANRERQSRFRQRQRNENNGVTSVTDNAKNVTDKEIEEEKDKPSASASQPRLGLDKGETMAARDILVALWPLVEETVSQAMTKTEWGKRNMRYARDLVAAGVSPERVVEAHASASRRLGSPCYSLKILQDEIARGVAPVRPQQQKARSGAELGYKVFGAQ